MVSDFYNDPEIKRLSKRYHELKTELDDVQKRINLRENELRKLRFESNIKSNDFYIGYANPVKVTTDLLYHVEGYFGIRDFNLGDTLFVYDYSPEYNTFELVNYIPYREHTGTHIPGIPSAIVLGMRQ